MTFQVRYSRPEDISWRVLYTVGGADGRRDFSDSGTAEEFFEGTLATLKNINDRVVLFRVNRTYHTYQDPYKFAVMSPKGVLFRYAPYSPKTWQDAERIIGKHREYRAQRHQREIVDARRYLKELHDSGLLR